MGVRDWLRQTFRRTSTAPIYPGRRSAVVETGWGMLTPYESRSRNVLDQLRRTDDPVDALDLLRKNNPDVSMSVWNFIRLSNVGHEMEFYGVGQRNKGKRLTDVEARWRDEVASRVNELSNSGLDGLIDQLHFSAFTRRGQGIEVEVAPTLDDLVDVYVIDPQTLEWKLEDRTGPDGRARKVWVPYQRQGFKEVDLSKANFFWVPTDPDLNDPRGNLIMGSVIQAIDFQMQVLSDLQKVIHNQGWPRYDIEIDLEKVLTSMPAKVKANPQEYEAWIKKIVTNLQSAIRDLEPDDSFVHTNDAKISKLGANADKSSVDARAVGEIIDTQMMSGAKQMGILVNRNSGVTETWGSIAFRIFVQGIVSVQRGSKRLIEEVARLWLRTQGIQARPRFVHHTIDWESEESRWRVQLMKQEFYAISQLMGWVDGDKAASETVGAERAYGKPSENIRASFAVTNGGEQGGYRDGPRNPDESVERSLQKEGRVLRLFGGDSAKGGD